MPSFYSHYYFGCLVYDKLTHHIQEVVCKYRNLYDAGQNGPDVLLYHAALKGSEIASMNHSIHRQSGEAFFKNFLDDELSEQELAYLFGFVCHFVFDALCHPYIEQYKNDTQISHMYLEMEFERFLLLKNRLDPFHYDLTTHIHPSIDLVKVMASIFQIDEAEVKKTLNKMKRMYTYTRPSSPLKRKMIYFVMVHFIKKPYLKDFVMAQHGKKECEASNLQCFHIMQEAIDIAVLCISDFSKGKMEHPVFKEIFG